MSFRWRRATPERDKFGYESPEIRTSDRHHMRRRSGGGSPSNDSHWEPQFLRRVFNKRVEEDEEEKPLDHSLAAWPSDTDSN